MHALCKLNIFTPSMNEMCAFVLMRWVQQLQALQIFGQIWHDIDFNFTNTLKQTINFPQISGIFLPPFKSSTSHVIFPPYLSWPYFQRKFLRMVQAFEQRHTFSPEYLPTSPPPSPAAWVVQHRDRDPVQSNKKNNGEALEKLDVLVVITKIGGGGDEGGSHVKMAESARFWWFLLMTCLFMNHFVRKNYLTTLQSQQ